MFLNNIVDWRSILDLTERSSNSPWIMIRPTTLDALDILYSALLLNINNLTESSKQSERYVMGALIVYIEQSITKV